MKKIYADAEAKTIVLKDVHTYEVCQLVWDFAHFHDATAIDYEENADGTVTVRYEYYDGRDAVLFAEIFEEVQKRGL